MKPDNSAAPSPRDPELPALAWLHRENAADELLRDVAAKLVRKRRRRVTLGAAALALALTLGLLASRLLRDASSDTGRLAAGTPSAAAHHVITSAPPSSATATVSRPERRTLPDGSVVELNAGAAIAVDFSGALRRVTLERGEAHFWVAKNPQRPFVVHAGSVEVQAIGTAFAVQLAANVDVLVTEGRVKVTAPAPAPAGEPPQALVDAGSRCVVDPGAAPRLVPIPPGHASTQLAWRVPVLDFSRAPLQEVLALVNEHTAAHGLATYEIAEPSLRDLKLTGVLRADNTAGLEHLLETSFGIRLERAAGKIRLHRQP